MTKTKFEKDQIVKFNYHKDNGETSERVLYVEKVDKNHIEGREIKGGYRNFKLSNVKNPQVLAGSKDDIIPANGTKYDDESNKALATCAEDVFRDFYSEVKYIKDIDALVAQHRDYSKDLRVNIVTKLNGCGSVTISLGKKDIKLDVSSFGYIRDVQVGGKSVGNDVDSLIGALEVLADE